ncbi:hypothetical protein CBS101457_006893 [Exobasidium rhododendri]|nr:hypothetical protein CBS101457_006893 [Exobasidium rhododendri]
MRGCDSGWRDVDTGAPRHGRRSLGGDSSRSDAGVFSSKAKAVQVDFAPFRLCYRHVFPAMICKAALVAFNLAQTKTKDAIFSQLHSLTRTLL